MDLNKQIKDLDAEQSRLLEKKKELEEKQQLQEVLHTKLEEFFKESKFATPRDLAEALVEKYGVKLGARRPGAPRRKRTAITADIRDTVKSKVNSGQSMNSVSKEMEISYAVIVKIMKGSYDHLKARTDRAA